MDIYVLSTTIPEDQNPMRPEVFGREDEAEAQADKTLRQEWATLKPLRPYPGDWRIANDLLAKDFPSWGTYALTMHTVPGDAQ